jgi:hypothetical protein
LILKIAELKGRRDTDHGLTRDRPGTDQGPAVRDRLGTKDLVERKTLFRGMGVSAVDTKKRLSFSSLEPGMTFKNRFLLSFSEKEFVALRFIEDKPDGVIYHVKTNNGLPMSSLSKYKTEREYLLHSGLNFEVTKKYVKNKRTYLELRILKKGAKVDYEFAI